MDSRVRRYIWGVFNSIQSNSLVHPKLRGVLLSLVGCELGKEARIEESVFIGSNSLQMGNDTFINVGCFIDGSGSVTLEDHVRLGPNVRILTGSHPYRQSVVRRNVEDRTVSQPVTIGRGSWIGMGALIMPGVVIGQGCVVGAGSVVIRSCEPNGLYVGNPARRVKDLSTQEDRIELGDKV